MTSRTRKDPEWREFEKLIARIEADAGPRGLTVKSPDRLRCQITGRLREVDASIRAKVGTSEILITIECRKRRKVQDVTWLEQLASKRNSIGANQTIAVSAAGFSGEAKLAAARLGISVRLISEVSTHDLNHFLGLDFVIFWHQWCACSGVGIRAFREKERRVPEPFESDFIFPSDTDLFAPIFHNISDGSRWSINDIWQAVQKELNPFAELPKGIPPVMRTARIPYDGNVQVETPDGVRNLGHVFLSMTMGFEPELVTREDALKVRYEDPTGIVIQRIEYSSELREGWWISAQVNADAADISEVRTAGNWPFPGHDGTSNSPD